ncbi:TolB family protein [Kitasatospora griseola]|uniref:TolB family protein n=1 Tax=Kitasatospora griseola TaxID=2064 RepID=UPI003441D18B
MSERIRLRRSAAALLVAAVTTGSALLLTACDPEGDTGTTAAPSKAVDSPAAAEPSGPAGGSPAPAGGKLNKTAGTKVTVSTGTNTVLMDGKSVDFGTVVRDLAWSPDGKHAAFIDGAGNLETSDPDGSHKTVIAKAPSGETWSHPTWQVYGPDEPHGAGTYLLFTADDKKALKLLSVEAKAGAKPDALHVGDSEAEKPLPDVGNLWPNSAGKAGATVYANKNDGQVYFHDVISRTNGGVITKGSQPALADDGTVVFVRSVSGHAHIFAKAHEQGAKEVDLTPGASVDYTEPVISHDGKNIAFRGPDGIYTMPAKGGTPDRITDTVGLPAYRS